MTLSASRPSESNHWYTREGAPMYSVPNRTGGQRATTLRDARKLNLVPSVTTILGLIAKPGLNVWLQRQVLLAALTLPRIEGETEGDYVSRIMRDAKEQGRKAADAGTEIHASIQGHYEGSPTGNHLDHVGACVLSIESAFGHRKWTAEKAFAHPDGFGGKCDLHADGFVIDIKTKEFASQDDVPMYEENMIQLAAYRHGLGLDGARCANVFVSRSVPGLVAVKEWSEEDLKRGLEMFKSLLAFWKLRTKA